MKLAALVLLSAALVGCESASKGSNSLRGEGPRFDYDRPCLGPPATDATIGCKRAESADVNWDAIARTADADTGTAVFPIRTAELLAPDRDPWLVVATNLGEAGQRDVTHVYFTITDDLPWLPARFEFFAADGSTAIIVRLDKTGRPSFESGPVPRRSP